MSNTTPLVIDRCPLTMLSGIGDQSDPLWELLSSFIHAMSQLDANCLYIQRCLAFETDYSTNPTGQWYYNNLFSQVLDVSLLCPLIVIVAWDDTSYWTMLHNTHVDFVSWFLIRGIKLGKWHELYIFLVFVFFKKSSEAVNYGTKYVQYLKMHTKEIKTFVVPTTSSNDLWYIDVPMLISF